MITLIICHHSGKALWCNHYAWYCYECGYSHVNYLLLGQVLAHYPGEHVTDQAIAGDIQHRCEKCVEREHFTAED